MLAENSGTSYLLLNKKINKDEDDCQSTSRHDSNTKLSKRTLSVFRRPCRCTICVIDIMASIHDTGFVFVSGCRIVRCPSACGTGGVTKRFVISQNGQNGETYAHDSISLRKIPSDFVNVSSAYVREPYRTTRLRARVCLRVTEFRVKYFYHPTEIFHFRVARETHPGKACSCVCLTILSIKDRKKRNRPLSPAYPVLVQMSRQN